MNGEIALRSSLPLSDVMTNVQTHNHMWRDNKLSLIPRTVRQLLSRVELAGQSG